MPQAIAQASIEATEAAIIAAREAGNPVENIRTSQQTLRVRKPILKQPILLFEKHQISMVNSLTLKLELKTFSSKHLQHTR